MRDFLIGESYDLFKNIYHSLDIRALLVKKDSRWRSLFCMVSASIDNLETVREIRNRKSDLGFKNPTGAEILLTVKRFDELPIILTNFRDGYLKVDKQKAKIFNSNFSNIDSCITKQSEL